MKAIALAILCAPLFQQPPDGKKILETAASKCLPCDGSGKLESLIPSQGMAECYYCKGVGKPKKTPVFYTAEDLSKAWKAKEVKFGGAPVIVTGTVKEASASGLIAFVRLTPGADVTVIQANLFGQAKRAADLKVGEAVTIYALFVVPPKTIEQTNIVLMDSRILDLK